jgi:hypothetical protein
MTSPFPLPASLPQRLLALLLGGLLWLSLQAPVRADPGRFLASAIARSDDRAQLHNDSRHNVGVFLRNKKDPSRTPAPFTVLGPGQETDDDYELVGFYVPAAVSLRWEPGGAPAAARPRVARLLEGQPLRLTDPAADPAATTYSLDLPVFALLPADSAAALVAELPAFSQAELDAQPVTAPTD